jgi:hypothetical protein
MYGFENKPRRNIDFPLNGSLKDKSLAYYKYRRYGHAAEPVLFDAPRQARNRTRRKRDNYKQAYQYGSEYDELVEYGKIRAYSFLSIMPSSLGSKESIMPSKMAVDIFIP